MSMLIAEGKDIIHSNEVEDTMNIRHPRYRKCVTGLTLPPSRTRYKSVIRKLQRIIRDGKMEVHGGYLPHSGAMPRW